MSLELKTEANVHPTAVIDPAALVPASCKIGPYCVVGPDVEMGENCELVSHVVLQGPTVLGDGNRIFPFACVGVGPQDLSYKDQPTRLEIGHRNVIREYVTVHRGTVKGGGLTRIGSDCLIMAYAHIAHDCFVGDSVIMANAATLAGHVMVEDFAVVGALCPVHQFVRIGTHSYVGGGTTITQDVLPFSKTVASRDVSAYGMNAIGLRRRGFADERIRKIHHAFKVLLASKLNTTQALAKLKAEVDNSEDVEMLIRWIEASERGVIK
jgi:UDP-N-acetylglucosamine acyltransferase